jgi:hypothetical protein
MPFGSKLGGLSFLSDDDKELLNVLIERMLGVRMFATDETIEITSWLFDQLKGENK